MGSAVGYDRVWKRDVGYGVPSVCDQPGCGAAIHRGLACVCGGQLNGGEFGRELFLCAKHP